ncbi:MAG TPA: hypothetical protein VMU10_04145, partial [Desulfomonilia bacterium]|nr:hypothetical protein [Desulfomonilia bacterium]
MKRAYHIALALAIGCVLWGCGGGGGGGKASGEEATTFDLSFPSELVYKSPEGTQGTPKESAAMDVTFSDSSFTISTTMSSYSSDGSATPIIKKDVTMDYSGNLLSQKTDVAPFGSSVENLVCTYTTTGPGIVIKRTFSVSTNGTESIQSSEKSEYDFNGKVTLKTFFNGDVTGNPASISTYAYDKNGRVSEKTIDSDADSTTPNEKHTYTYDDKGRVTEEVIDSNDDGTPDTKNDFVYDSNGNMTFTKSYSWDTTEQDWKSTSDWIDAWYYVYPTSGSTLPQRVSYNRGNLADSSNLDYTDITWKTYPAPVKAKN